MYLCSSTMPPGKDIGAYLSKYVHDVANVVGTDPENQALDLNTCTALKRFVKVGPMCTIPGHEEIETLLTSRKLATIVFFLDETFEEIMYDMTTIVEHYMFQILQQQIFHLQLTILILLLHDQSQQMAGEILKKTQCKKRKVTKMGGMI